ncbi:MAG: NAD-dependent epimerase/dehydratase family protein, partial [Planctomycetota bacterium]|nr:NAD-dependent epimerase/dehydratase family protein [Planctomycetota bacterium]
MKILVVGGAGYIGSHCVLESLRARHEILVLDDLRTGHRESIPDVELVQGSLHEARVLKSVFESNRIDAVFNLAARAGVRYSMENPHVYLSTNAEGSLNLLECMREYG